MLKVSIRHAYCSFSFMEILCIERKENIEEISVERCTKYNTVDLPKLAMTINRKFML